MDRTTRIGRKRRHQGLSFEALEVRTLLAGDPILQNQPLIISEFMADSNSSLITRTRSSVFAAFEGDADSPDWIEVMNVSGQRVDVSGMHLTDDAADPGKWSFPAGTSVEAGGFLVVFASGEDTVDPLLDENGYLHTNFRMSGGGEYLALTGADGSVVHEFAPAYPAQRTDVSYAAPMEVRTLVSQETAVEYLVPTDDALEPQWRQPGFTDPNLMGTAADLFSPVGFDQGGGPAEAAETIGTELVKRSSIDFARGSLVVLEGSPFSEPGRVAEWSIYSEKERTITPLVLRAHEGEFEIVGVGSTRLSDGSGAQTFAFDLQSGSDAVDANGYFFGFKDGDNQTDEAGVVVYGSSDTDLIRRYNGPLSGSVTVGQQLTEGRQFDRSYSVQVTTLARLAGPVKTSVEEAMSDATSLYVRYPFTAGQTGSMRSLSLNVRYDDGFVAYLNGTEIARRNVPQAVSAGATALSNRPLSQANEHEQINVSQFTGLLTEGENVLALHGFNDDLQGVDFLIDAQLVAVHMESVADIGYAAETTPGKTNRQVFRDLLEPTSVSHSRGFYEDAFSLELATPAAPDANIYYTTDGTEPVPENPAALLYEQPLAIGQTTNLRAASYQEDLLPSQSVTHTYLFTSDVIRQDTLQQVVTGDPVWGPQLEDSLRALPTVSVVTSESISVEGEFPTSVEYIFPDGSEGFQVNAGIEVFGGTAVSFPKRSFRVSFKNIYGPSTFVYDVFDDPNGVTEFDQLLLRPGSHDTPFWDGAVGRGAYIRNRWMNDRQLEMGQPSPRGRFVQLYLNGAYWGQYQLVERPNAAFMAANFGGDASEYDVLNAGRVVDGDDVAWNALIDSLDDGYQAVQEYLDVVNYADYVLLQFYGGNTVDWRSEANWMAARRRAPGAGFQFFAWDSDIVLRTGAESDIVNFGGPGFLLTKDGGVLQYPEFRQLLAERAQLLFYDDGVLTDAALREQMDAFIEQLQVSVIAETARWGSGVYTPDSWLAAVAWIKDTYAPADGPSRAATVVEQLRHAGSFPLADQPELSVNGTPVGETVSVGDQLLMSAPEGTIYYTLDGSDPWLTQPVVDDTTLVSETSPTHVLIPQDGSLRSDWRDVGFDDSAWISGENGVGFDTSGELSPFIRLDVQSQMQNNNATAYLRFAFQVDDPSQFESLDFSLQFDDGFVAYLNGVEVARRNAGAGVNWNSRSSSVRANVEAIEFERFNLAREIDLLQPGENMLAIHALNTDAANVDMLITPVLKAGIVTDVGSSPTALRYTGPIRVPDGASIAARTVWGDQWSTLRAATVESASLPLRVSEVMYHPADPSPAEETAGFRDGNDFEFIELVNISSSPIDLSDVQFVQTVVGGQTEGVQFDFAGSAVSRLEPGARVIIVEDLRAFVFRYGDQLPVAGQWSGGLSNNTEQLTVNAAGEMLQQFTYDDDWHTATDGGGASLEIADPTRSDLDSWNQRDRWRPSAVAGGTPGTGDAGPAVGDSNHDGVFDAEDLLAVFQAGEYEDDIVGNSTFEEGDWNGDGDFTTDDLVLAFRDGLYVNMAAAKNALENPDTAAAVLLGDRRPRPESTTRPALPDSGPSAALMSVEMQDRLFGQLAEPESLRQLLDAEHELAGDVLDTETLKVEPL